MSTMDLDDLDGSSGAPARRPSRFAPKSSKPKLIPKPEPSSQPELSRIDDTPLTNKKEEDYQPPLLKKDEEPFCSSTQNGGIGMEVEPKAEDAMEEDDRDEDPVVREIDVFFSPSPFDDKTKIYVLQYPLRPCWRPYELDERCDEVRVKPASAEVEVDLSIDVDSKNYDPEAPNAQWMNKQTLSTSWKPPQTAGYAVGVLMGNKLHLNPVHAVVQLRPSMEYLSSGGAKRRNNVTGDVEPAVKLEVSKEESVGSLRKLNKKMGTLDEQNTDAAESWIPLKYHSSENEFSARYRQKMVAQDNSSIEFLMSPYEYMSSLCPGVSKDDKESKGPSIRSLLQLPLEERISAFFKVSPVHRFSAIKHIAPDHSVEDILGVLTKHTQLVQGLWVLKSSLLFAEENAKEKAKQKGHEMLARDYILLLFNKDPVIKNSQLDVPGLLQKFLNNSLKKFAVQRPSLKDWKFKEPTDMSFIKQHPDIVREQKRVWESQEKRITDSVYGGKKVHVTKNFGKPSNANKILTKSEGATRATNGTLVRRTAMSVETREALPKALEEVFRLHKVCSFQLICQALRDLAVSKSTSPKADPRTFVAAAYSADAPQEELHEIITKYATNVHGVYVWKTSENSEHNPLRKVVIDLFCGKEPNAKLKRADIMEAAKIALKKEITTHEYNKVVSELCESKGSLWVLRSGDGKPK